MRHACHCTLLAAVGIVAVLGTPVSAQFSTPSLEELATRADTVFRGQVVDTQPYWDEGPWGRAIATRVVFAVERVYKGPAATRATLEFLGGTIGDLSFVVETMPRFTAGERDVLFVMSGTRLANPIVAAPFGRLRVTRDSRGIETVAAFEGMRFPEGSGIDLLRMTPDGRPAMLLQQFESALAQVLNRRR